MYPTVRGHLRWLDLSFNKLTAIEGLDTLTKLTDLTLLSNRIEKLEKLDSLVHLNVLSMGNNLIKELRQVRAREKSALFQLRQRR